VAAEERRPLRADRIHHARDVVQAVFEGLIDGSALRHTGARAIEHDQSREAAETREEPGERGELPLQREVARPPEEEDQVRTGVAHDLVGDLHAVGSCRVADGRDLEPHGPGV
jgi:hypothetical protein